MLTLLAVTDAKAQNYSRETGGTCGIVNKLSEYDKTRLRNHDLVVLANVNATNTLNQVVGLMASWAKVTGNVVAAIKLKDGNFVVYKDGGNKEVSASMLYTVRDDGGYYKGIKIRDFYHTHHDISRAASNPLDISDADLDVA